MRAEALEKLWWALRDPGKLLEDKGGLPSMPVSLAVGALGTGVSVASGVEATPLMRLGAFALGVLVSPVLLACSAGLFQGGLWLLGARRAPYSDSLKCLALGNGVWVACTPLLVVALAASATGVVQVLALATGVLYWVALFRLLSAVHGAPWRVASAFVCTIAVPALFAGGLRTFAIEAFKMPAASMWPTLRINDHIFIKKYATSPERGQMIVFQFPGGDEPMDFVKRVVGFPGDRIETRGRELFINGTPVPQCPLGSTRFQDSTYQLSLELLGNESYIVAFDQNYDTGRLYGPYTVEPGEVFVLGDNRHNSHDSRSWNAGRGGGVPAPLIKGTVWRRWMSFDAQDAPSVHWDALHGEPGLPPELEASLREAVEDCLRRHQPTH